MYHFYGFLLSVVIGVAIVFILVNAVTFFVYGLPVSDSYLDEYFGDDLGSFHLNYYNDKILCCHEPEDVYISSTMPFPILFRWHLGNGGVIPKWSKWDKKLSEYRESLIEKQNETKS